MLQNEFSKKTRALFDLGWYCYDFEDWANDVDCLHHILGRCSNSPYNACPLNNLRNHMPEWRTSKWLPDIHTFEVEKKYLLSTMSFLENIWYEPTLKDKEFIKSNSKYYWDISL